MAFADSASQARSRSTSSQRGIFAPDVGGPPRTSHHGPFRAHSQPTYSPIRFLDLTARTRLGSSERGASDPPLSLLQDAYRSRPGMSSKASPDGTPESRLPAWPRPTMELADPDRAGLTVSTRSPGGLPRELPRPSRGRRVVRENDSCSPLRRCMPATPPSRSAAISSRLSMPCCHAGTFDGRTSNRADPICNQLPTPPRRREQPPDRPPHPQRGMVLMGAHAFSDKVEVDVGDSVSPHSSDGLWLAEIFLQFSFAKREPDTVPV